MIAWGTIKSLLQKLIDDDSPETAAEMLEYANVAYRQICSDHIWQSLLAELSISGTSTTLPGDLERPVLYLQDDTDDTWFPISITDRYASSKLNNWYPNGTITEPLVYASDGVVVAGSTAFTSAAPSTSFTSAMVGEYIQIGTNGGIYEIAALVSTTAITLQDGYRGASDTAQYYEVRPVGTQKIAYSDYDGAAATVSSSGKLWYQRRPLPLYNDHDQLLLPGTCEAVRIMIFQMLLQREKYDTDSVRQEPTYQRAIASMNPLDPTRGRQPKPRDRNGGVIRFGRWRSTVRVDTNSRRILGT